MRFDTTLIVDLKFKKQIEERKDVTYSDISKATGISHTTLMRFARGDAKRPNTKTMVALADFFGVELEYFVVEDDDEGNMPPQHEAGGRLIRNASAVGSAALPT